MSVYGNMILESNRSIEDISNDINITCLEFNNYSTFLDEYVLNENYDIINEGIGDVISSIFNKIKELIEKMIGKIRSVGNFILDLFRKNKSSEKESDKIIKTINNAEIVDEDEFSKIKSKTNTTNNNVNTTNNNVNTTNNNNHAKINTSDFNTKSIKYNYSKNNSKYTAITNSKFYLKDMQIPFEIIDYPSAFEIRYSVIAKYLRESDNYKKKFDKLLKSTVYDMGNQKNMGLELHDKRNRYMMPKLPTYGDDLDLKFSGYRLLKEGSYYSDFKKLPNDTKKSLLSPFSHDNKSKEMINKLEKRFNDIFKYAEKLEKKLKYEKDGEFKFSNKNNISQKDKDKFMHYYSDGGREKVTKNSIKKYLIEDFKDEVSRLMKETNNLLKRFIDDNKKMFNQATKLKTLFSKAIFSQKAA